MDKSNDLNELIFKISKILKNIQPEQNNRVIDVVYECDFKTYMINFHEHLIKILDVEKVNIRIFNIIVIVFFLL